MANPYSDGQMVTAAASALLDAFDVGWHTLTSGAIDSPIPYWTIPPLTAVVYGYLRPRAGHRARRAPGEHRRTPDHSA